MNHEPSRTLAAILRHPFVVMMALGMGVRFVLMPLLTFTVDMSYWVRISNIADSGFGLYEVEGYYYTPVWGCIMAVVTALCNLLGISTYGTVVPELLQFQGADFPVSPIVTTIGYNVMVKLPLVIVDAAVAYCIFDLVRDIAKDDRKAVLAASLWFLCPLVVEVSSMHGMFDNMSALFLLLSVMMVRKGDYFWAGAAFSTSVLTKFFPVFFVFFLAAWLFRREGTGRQGFICLGRALAGAVAAVVVIEIPAIVNGTFWESVFFLTERVGLSTEFLKSVFTVKTFIILIAGLALLAVLLYLFNRRYEGGYLNHVASMDPQLRDRKVRRHLLALFGILTAGLIIYSIGSVGGSSFNAVFTSIGMKFVMILSVLSGVLEMYLAYRLMYYGDLSDRRVFGLALLAAMLMFLWPPAPQYVIVLVPFIAVYCVVCSDRVYKPFICMSLLMVAFQFVLAGISCLFPLAVETGIISMSSLLPAVEFFTSYLGDIPLYMVLMAVVGGSAYIMMLSISYQAIKGGSDAEC